MRSLLTACLACLSLAVAAQTYTRPASKAEQRTAQHWMKAGGWCHGFTAAKPHQSVNAAEFMAQYRRNTAQWQAAFKWLAATDLTALPAGRHPIPGSTLTASVEDSENAPLERCMSESHREHIDLQYVVGGTERFGIIEHESSTPNCAYTPDVIHYDFDAARTRFYDSRPDRFFLFFPDDWHIAKVATGKGSQKIRVVVIKIDYVK